MTAAALGVEDALPRRARVVGRPVAATAAVPSPTRTRTRERASHLHAVPDGATAATVAAPPRPVRGTRPVTADASAATKTRGWSIPAVSMPKVAVAAPARHVLSIVYSDVADGWIVQNRTLSIGEVWSVQYAVPGDWKPFQLWTRIYTRSFGVVFAAVLDGVKWTLIHPVRGPLAGLITGGAVTASHFIH